MRATKRAELPKDLLRARRRFQAWRQRCKRGDRVPPALWTLAIRLARIHGFSRTAVALGVNYFRLKKRSEATMSVTARSRPPATGPTFVELPTPAVLGKQCLLELNTSAGTSLRVQLLGYDTADVEALARAVWSVE